MIFFEEKLTEYFTSFMKVAFYRNSVRLLFSGVNFEFMFIQARSGQRFLHYSTYLPAYASVMEKYKDHRDVFGTQWNIYDGEAVNYFFPKSSIIDVRLGSIYSFGL